MISSEENAGLFTFLVGMIVLVMSAVGLSVVADKYIKSSRGVGEIHQDIAAHASEISAVKSNLDERSRLLGDSGVKLQAASKTHRQVSSELESLRQRQAALKESKVRLGDAITALETDFAQYRANYRSKAWASAVGEKLGALTLRGGRGYQQAVITRVTEVGLEIRHSDGIARIQAPDLDPAFHDRFQWSDEERRRRLKEELENHRAAAGEPDPENSVPEEMAVEPERPALVEPAGPDQAGIDAEKLMELRQQVLGWRAKLGGLTSEQAQAASRVGYGSQSVPGSLETWSARAARLGREVARAQVGLSVAKSKLAEISPNDSLLKEPQREY